MALATLASLECFVIIKYTKFGQLILRKIIKIVATRRQILRLKMHQIRFRLWLRPRPRWGSLQRSPDSLAGFWAASWQGEGLGWGRGGKVGAEGEGGEVERREREGPQVTVEPGPLRALLRH